MAHETQPCVSVMFLIHFWHTLWSITVQTHDNMEYFLFYMKSMLLFSNRSCARTNQKACTIQLMISFNYFLFLFWTLQTEVKMALCKLNNTVLGELGSELQTQIKVPNVTDLQVFQPKTFLLTNVTVCARLLISIVHKVESTCKRCSGKSCWQNEDAI